MLFPDTMQLAIAIPVVLSLYMYRDCFDFLNEIRIFTQAILTSAEHLLWVTLCALCNLKPHYRIYAISKSCLSSLSSLPAHACWCFCSVNSIGMVVTT